MPLRPLLVCTLFAVAAPAAQAATITLDRLTTPIASNAKVTAVPSEIASSTGNVVASGQVWTGGAGFGLDIADTFLAWCFDLAHPLSLGQGYDYAVVEAPFAESYLAAGAARRVSHLVNAVYEGLDAYDPVQAAGFQLAVWEVSNDDDFDIDAGDFQARGKGQDHKAITAQAQGFLDAGAAHDGAAAWRVHFLETRERTATQNLITATRVSSAPDDVPDLAPIPVPAAGGLLVAALGGLSLLRRHRRRHL